MRSSLLSLIPLVAGCATYRPLPLEPKVELAALERAGGDRPAAGLGEAELVGLALAHNPGLAVERARIGEADSVLLAAGAWPGPTLDRVWRPGVGHADGHSVEGELLFPLPRPGERGARRAAAKAGAEAARAGLEAREWEVVAEVRKARLRVLAAAARDASLQEERAIRQGAVEMLAARRRAGEGGELPLALAELERADLDRERAAVGRERAEARAALVELLGLPPRAALAVAGEGAELPAEDGGLDPEDGEIDARLLAGRPELAALEAGYRKAEAELKLAIASQYPGLALGSAWARENDGTKFRGTGLGLQLPDFGGMRGAIEEKRAARDRVRAEYRALLHRLRAAAFKAREVLRLCRAEEARVGAEVAPRVRRLDELVERGLKARLLDFVSAASARQQVLEARRDLVAGRVRVLEARIELEAALGFGAPGAGEGKP